MLELIQCGFAVRNKVTLKTLLKTIQRIRKGLRIAYFGFKEKIQFYSSSAYLVS